MDNQDNIQNQQPQQNHNHNHPNNQGYHYPHIQYIPVAQKESMGTARIALNIVGAIILIFILIFILGPISCFACAAGTAAVVGQ